MPISYRLLAPIGLIAALAAITVSAPAQDLEGRLKALETRLNETEKSLTDEVARLKNSLAMPELSGASFMGMGAGASKIYFTKNPLSIGGYGEVAYYDPRGGSAGNSTDMYRFIPYFSYRFSDHIIFNSEVEFEHGNQVAVEFAYLDFILRPGVGLRLGHMLVPMGIVNLKHEPTYFHSVLRPEVEVNLIPSTWHENGAMIFAEQGAWRAHLGVLNGFKAAATGATIEAKSWVRKFRTSAQQAPAEHLGYVARIDWSPRSEIEIGTSYYWGESGQTMADSLGDAVIRLWEIHAEWARFGWEVEALWALGSLTDVAFTLPAGGVLPGRNVNGGYITLAYDILRGKDDKKLKLFTRYTAYDLQAEIQPGATRDKSLDKQIWTLGVNYFPHPQVVVKGDFEIRDNAAGEEDDKLQLGVGLVF